MTQKNRNSEFVILLIRMLEESWIRATYSSDYCMIEMVVETVTVSDIFNNPPTKKTKFRAVGATSRYGSGSTKMIRLQLRNTATYRHT
jgi:hypothetical protein